MSHKENDKLTMDKHPDYNPRRIIGGDHKITIYYLDPHYVNERIGQIFSQDLELFELAVIHHEKVRRMEPAQFQLEFNSGLVSDEGYIVIK